MKRNCSLLTVMALIAVMQVSWSQSDLQGRVAQIFGKDIFISDLNPTDDELRMVKRSRQDLSDDQIVSEVRSGLEAVTAPGVYQFSGLLRIFFVGHVGDSF